MNRLTASMVRGLKGAPASILILLQCVNQPVTNAWIAAETGFTDKPVAAGLVYLKELGVVVHVLGGWRLAGGEEQLPLTLPADDEPDTAQADDAPAPASRNESDSYGVGVVLSINDLNTESFKHQQHHDQESRNYSDSPANLPAGDPDRGRARVALLRAGVWPNQVETILAGLRPERGLGDVLGWIAYCQDDASGVDKPAAIVAGKLKRGEWPSSAWIAPRICGVCRLIEGRCLCQDPAYHYPPDYDELAFEPPPAYDRDTWLANRWRCNVCYSHPCQCEALPDTQEEQEQ